MNHIEKAYKAWRATVKEPRTVTGVWKRLDRTLSPTERARNAVKSFWQTLTPEQRSERQRKAAKKMWKRRKAERSA